MQVAEGSDSFNRLNPGLFSLRLPGSLLQVYLYGINDRKVAQTLDAHSDMAIAMDVSKTRQFLATGGMEKDPTVRFWAPKI